MNKKGIIAVGPVLVIVNFFVLLFTTVKVLLGTSFILGVAYNKKLRKQGIKEFFPKIALFLVLSIAIMTSVHFLVGPTGNHTIGMLFGSVLFLIIISLILAKDYKINKKLVIKEILFSTILFTLISQISVLLVLI